MKNQKNQKPKSKITFDEVVAQMEELSKEIGVPFKVITRSSENKVASIHFINKKKK